MNVYGIIIAKWSPHFITDVDGRTILCYKASIFAMELSAAHMGEKGDIGMDPHQNDDANPCLKLEKDLYTQL